MELTSTAFQQGQPVPTRHTADGQDVSLPLQWANLPEGTKQLALICDDPDAPTPQPWVHWVIYNIPVTLDGLPEGLPRQAALEHPVRATQGANAWPDDNLGYRGPAPPYGHGVHHYHFKLYAISTELDLEPGLDKPQLLQAINSHLIAKTELVGTYER